MHQYQPFPNTHWSLVRVAGLADPVARREALRVLLERYVPALKSYLCLDRRMCEDNANEVLQAFIAERILERDLIARADAGKGRFRTFLLTSLRNFAVSRHRREKVRDAASLRLEIADGGAPTCDMAVQAAWARTLIHGVIDTMEAECRQTGRNDVWQVFEERILAQVFDHREPTAYSDLARRLKLSSPMQAANLLVTAKRMYGRLLHAAVAEYEREPGEIDNEIVDLWRILADSPAGRDEPQDESIE